MSNLIDKQAAIDLWDKYHPTIAVDAMQYDTELRQLPPAQPEPCEDAVSREEVLNCLEWQYPNKLPRTKIMELPPVTLKQRTGYWYPVGMAEVVGGESAMWGSVVAYHKCSECDEQALKDDFEQEVLSKWCPHCGAKMEGANNETD